MRPIKNNIIIEPIEYAQSPSGLFIKASTTEKLTGKVIAVGEGTDKNPMSIRVGEIVQYHDGVGTEISKDGTDYLLLRETHVIAIV